MPSNQLSTLYARTGADGPGSGLDHPRDIQLLPPSKIHGSPGMRSGTAKIKYLIHERGSGLKEYLIGCQATCARCIDLIDRRAKLKDDVINN